MPCRMDDMPTGPSLAEITRERDLLKKKGDKLQADLCLMGEILSGVLNDRISIPDAQVMPAVKRLLVGQVAHRKSDRARFLKAQVDRLTNAKSARTRTDAAKLISQAAELSDDELLTTTLF